MNSINIIEEFEKLRDDESYSKVICEKINTLPQNKNRELLEKFAQFSKENNLEQAYPWFLYKLGCAYYNSSNTQASIEKIRTACYIFEKHKDYKGVINASIALMSIYSYCYRFAQAIETGLKAMDIANETMYYEAISIIKASIVGLYIDMEDYEKAKYILKELEEISYIGNKQNEVIIALNRAICEIKTGNLKTAEEYIEKSRIMALDGNYNLMSMVLQEKANLLKVRGLYEDADRAYKESTELARKNEFYLNLADTFLDWMELDIIRENYQGVIQKSRLVFENIGNEQDYRLLRRLHNFLSTAYKAIGDSNLALLNLEKYIIIDKKFSEALKAVNIKDLELRSAKEKADTYINLCNQKDKLYCAGQNIISNLDEEGVFSVLANEIKETVSSDIIQIACYDESEGFFSYKISLENGKRIYVEPSPIEGNTFAGYCIRNNKEIFINDMENEYYRYVKDFNHYIERIRTLQTYCEDEAVDEIPGSAIFIPVNFRDKVIGVISTQSFKKNAYTLDDLNSLKVISTYAGIAINNARSYTKLEHSANHDFLTKLLTRRHILDIGKDIYKKNKDLQLCVLMIDIDNFKMVNDTYGHTVGDIVLKKVAEIIKYSVRGDDHVGRYGGEEFIVLMNEFNADIYLEVAERIRLNVSENSNTVISPGEEINVTVSIGLSCMNIDKKEISQLIEESDKALYEAKASGKNKVIVYGD